MGLLLRVGASRHELEDVDDGVRGRIRQTIAPVARIVV